MRILLLRTSLMRILSTQVTRQIYSQFTGDDGPVPTSFNFNETNGVPVEGATLTVAVFSSGGTAFSSLAL